ncbi:alpha/beta fold hydrolase [Roseomonas sp. 18066]|uniref:alpha/beta fold hydrolase n=1 Tax=Roseomonas sp. 18066 TaxID=2681412 RepID=UPI001F2C41D1|nr:alpha/beta hydrolase [Roseomonas sp. 18066]
MTTSFPEPRLGAIRVPLPPGAPALGARVFGAVDLRWVEWGPPEGAPVLCLHGLSRNGRDFDPLAMALAAEGRRVLCIDMPGRGLSSWLSDPRLYAVPTYVALLQPLLRELKKPFDLVGTSMGGLIGLGLASIPGQSRRRASLRRLVLNDVGAAIPGSALAHIGAYLAETPGFESLEAVEAHLRRIHAGFGALSDAQWRHLACHSARALPNGRLGLHHDPGIGRALGPAIADVSLWPLWSVLRPPVLLLRGADSPLLTAETAARMATRPGTTLVTFDGCGHAPALMAAEQIETVAGFLR